MQKSDKKPRKLFKSVALKNTETSAKIGNEVDAVFETIASLVR